MYHPDLPRWIQADPEMAKLDAKGRSSCCSRRHLRTLMHSKKRPISVMRQDFSSIRLASLLAIYIKQQTRQPAESANPVPSLNRYFCHA